jgi:hypothetical protein
LRSLLDASSELADVIEERAPLRPDGVGVSLEVV